MNAITISAYATKLLEIILFLMVMYIAAKMAADTSIELQDSQERTESFQDLAWTIKICLKYMLVFDITLWAYVYVDIYDDITKRFLDIIEIGVFVTVIGLYEVIKGCVISAKVRIVKEINELSANEGINIKSELELTEEEEANLIKQVEEKLEELRDEDTINFIQNNANRRIEFGTKNLIIGITTFVLLFFKMQ